ncbi:MAG: DUF3291 domain-containing protein [Pseudomonadota bacterium]
MAAFHLAQLNVGITKGPMDSPIMAEFANNLDRINALAEASPGFVWRLQDEDGNATALRPFDDDTLVNLSVWESADALKAYVYQSAHADIMKRRREWFIKMFKAHLVLWWVPAGHRPSTDEARDRLEHLHTHGPSPHAFTFAKIYEPTTA